MCVVIVLCKMSHVLQASSQCVTKAISSDFMQSVCQFTDISRAVLLDGFTSMGMKLQILVTPYGTAYWMHVVIIYSDASMETGKLFMFSCSQLITAELEVYKNWVGYLVSGVPLFRLALGCWLCCTFLNIFRSLICLVKPFLAETRNEYGAFPVFV